MQARFPQGSAPAPHPGLTRARGYFAIYPAIQGSVLLHPSIDCALVALILVGVHAVPVGASWGLRRVLGSLEDLCAALKGYFYRGGPILNPQGLQNGPPKAPKGTPEAPKMDPKRAPEIGCLQLPNLKLSWNDLGPILTFF